MNGINNILENYIYKNIPDNEVAVLLSGGADSLSLAFASHNLGKKVHAYNFYLDGDISYDTRKANIASSLFKWQITNVNVPRNNLKQDFKILQKKYKCKKKTQYECTFPFLYIFPKIKQKYVLSGIAADGWYGVSKRAMINFREPKELFDKFRNDYFGATNPAGILQQRQLAEEYNKILVHPYLWVKDIKDFFMQYSHKELHIGTQKSHIKKAYKEYFNKIGNVKGHLNLQLISGIDKLFETLLYDKEINFKNRKRVMDICRDWAI